MHPIIRDEPLGHPWPGVDPFLFIAHHMDRYPASDGDQGVPAPLRAGRDPRSDFSARDGFSMYHGERVPGFPAHPHRGFETVTIVLQGLVDHADSLGATARYGKGDVQWLTAGAGAMHSEMFPLEHANADNPLDLYQVWLNLPPQDKLAPPAFTMLWGPTIPEYVRHADNGALATAKIVAGPFQPVEGGDALVPPPPAPDSWAAKPQNQVAIWMIRLEPGTDLTLPAADPRSRRTLYFHHGRQVQVAGEAINGPRLLQVDPTAELALANTGSDVVEIMLLQGVPIGAPVAAQGPFVMNTQAEIDQARRDFGRTRFGGWPWPSPGPVHPPGEGRFAKHPGSDAVERPPA